MIDAASRRDPATYVGGGQFASKEALSRSRKAYWSKIPPQERVTLLQSFIEAGQKHNKRAFGTRVESTVAGILGAMGVSFRQNVQLGRYNVDFVIDERVILECFGDFWHCNPALYSPADYNKSLHMTAEEKWGKDLLRTSRLVAQGFSVFVVWEGDVRTDPLRVMSELTRILE